MHLLWTGTAPGGGGGERGDGAGAGRQGVAVRLGVYLVLTEFKRRSVTLVGGPLPVRRPVCLHVHVYACAPTQLVRAAAVPLPCTITSHICSLNTTLPAACCWLCTEQECLTR
jgi:hypothetical protein